MALRSRRRARRASQAGSGRSILLGPAVVRRADEALGSFLKDVAHRHPARPSVLAHSSQKVALHPEDDDSRRRGAAPTSLDEGSEFDLFVWINASSQCRSRRVAGLVKLIRMFGPSSD
jgi:hypothetical protein